MAGESLMIETVVCGYHVYKEIRCAAVGEELSVELRDTSTNCVSSDP